ncbi:MAG: hypothetical protein IJ545_00770 [Alphaproteobacteria bacterium]|nr:hypothetical protein [Alphaproteobacteria bacterium]
MNFIKNIFLVSYLKNKGVRRICFILGILFAILPTMIWYENLNHNFYQTSKETKNEYNSYSNRENDVNKNYPKVRMPDGVIVEFPENMQQKAQIKQWIAEKYPSVANELKNTTSENKLRHSDNGDKNNKINYLYLLKFLWSLFWFYLPFLLSCIVKWIYTGFKEK